MVKDTPSKNLSQTSTNVDKTFENPCAGMSTSWTGRRWFVVMREGNRASRKMPMLTLVAVCGGLWRQRAVGKDARGRTIRTRLACEKRSERVGISAYDLLCGPRSVGTYRKKDPLVCIRRYRAPLIYTRTRIWFFYDNVPNGAITCNVCNCPCLDVPNGVECRDIPQRGPPPTVEISHTHPLLSFEF